MGGSSFVKAQRKKGNGNKKACPNVLTVNTSACSPPCLLSSILGKAILVKRENKVRVLQSYIPLSDFSHVWREQCCSLHWREATSAAGDRRCCLSVSCDSPCGQNNPRLRGRDQHACEVLMKADLRATQICLQHWNLFVKHSLTSDYRSAGHHRLTNPFYSNNNE